MSAQGSWIIWGGRLQEPEAVEDYRETLFPEHIRAVAPLNSQRVCVTRHKRPMQA